MYPRFSPSKQQRIGVGKTLLVQGVLAIVVLAMVRANYNRLTVADGIVQTSLASGEVFLQLPEAPRISQTDGDRRYQGVFGTIVHTSKQSAGTVFSSTTKTTDVVALKQDVLYMYHVVFALLSNQYIDAKTAMYLLTTAHSVRVLQDFVALGVLQWTTIPDPSIVEPYKLLLADKKYAQLITTLENLELMMRRVLQKSITPKPLFSDNFFTHRNFAYIREMLLIDAKDQYRSDINKVANLLWLDPDLIRAAIMSEQVRWFFTYKGAAEKVLGDSFGIMSMGQGSYGIGGIKVEAAQRAEQRLSQQYPAIFREQFGTLSSPATIQERLESHTDYWQQVLYAGIILKKISLTRARAGYTIDDQPGVILTLYNIGDDKTPRTNPQVGGAEIELAGQTYSFGELGMKLYYRLKVQ